MDHSKQIQTVLDALTSQVTRNQGYKKRPNNTNNNTNNSTNITYNKSNNTKSKKQALTPAQLLVIIGILSGSLSVDSVSLDKDQTVQILLAGSLKRKTALDEMIDELGEMPFEDVFKTMMERLG